MNIQRDVNPENDKKLDKMLDAKFGKQTKRIVTGDVARALHKARKQFDDNSFNPPKETKVAKDTQEPTGHVTLPGRDKTTQVTKQNKVGDKKPKSDKIRKQPKSRIEEARERGEKIRSRFRRVSKHGSHDQRTHSPTGRAAIARERGKPKGPSSPAPSKVRARVAIGERVRGAKEFIGRNRERVNTAIKDVDAILDAVDAGTRLYSELKDVKDALQGRLKKPEEKVTKAKMSPKELAESKRLAEDLKGKEGIDNPHALARWQVQHKKFVKNTIEKGIGHSLDILTNAIELIGNQEESHHISEADEKKLGEIIDEIQDMVGYLKEVKSQGFFEKAVVDKHGSHDQSSHSPTGDRGSSRTAPDTRTMLAGKVNRELDSLEAKSSKLTSDLIDAGRGSEKPSETRQKTDPLALKFNALHDRLFALRSEVSRRYGPNAPSRLPRGFGSERRKVSKRTVDKHGSHDQRSHGKPGRVAADALTSPTGAARAGVAVGRAIKPALGRAGQAARRVARTLTPPGMARAGAKLRQQLRGKKKPKNRMVATRRKKKQKVTKHGSHDQSSHAPESRSRGTKEPRLGRAMRHDLKQKLLNDMTDEGRSVQSIRSVYGKDVAQQVKRLFDRGLSGDEKRRLGKGVPHEPNSGHVDRPSFTTPAVAREQKRQGIKPNAKGRGTSTARAPGY